MENDTAITDALHEARWHRHCSGLSIRDNTHCALSPCYSYNTGQQQEEHYRATDPQHNAFHRRHVAARYVQVLIGSSFMAFPTLRVYEIVVPGEAQ